MNWLVKIDTFLFYWINRGWQNPVFDLVMPFVTDLDNWLIPIGIAVILLLFKGGKTGRIVVLLLIPTIALSDQLSAQVFKPLFGRIRPCIALDDVHLLLNRKKSFSFPSSHATNMAAVALVFTYHYRRYWWGFWAFAGMIGFSRIYVGVHYPLDVLAGFIIGGGCGAFVVVSYYQWLGPKLAAWFNERRDKKTPSENHE